MPTMILNLALLFVLQLSALEFFFWHREDLFHGVAEFLGRLLDLMNGGRHGRTIRSVGLFQQTAFNKVSPTFLIKKPAARDRPNCSDAIYKLRLNKFVKFKFHDLLSHLQRVCNLVSIQTAVVFCEEKQYLHFNFRTI